MTSPVDETMRRFTAYLGFGSVGLFLSAFIVLGALTPGFDWLNDHISKLGARNQPYCVWWNASGFVGVGVLFAVFGWSFGKVVVDPIVGSCLALAGFGFALGAIPADFMEPDSPQSKAHFVSICLSLAGWCFALARLPQVELVTAQAKRITFIAAILVVGLIIGAVTGLYSEPLSHRFVLTIVFSWVVFLSWNLLKPEPTRPTGVEQPQVENSDSETSSNS